MITAMQSVFPDIGNTNVEVGYVASGIDSVANSNLVTALVTVNLTDVTHSFVVLNIVPGVPATITYPEFSTSALRSTEGITPVDGRLWLVGNSVGAGENVVRRHVFDREVKRADADIGA